MASSWAKRRQIYYGVGVFIFILLIIIPITYAILHESPTCFDGKLNQGETSIDKGGPCTLLDESTLQPLKVLWTRPFKVRDGVYNTVAYIENTNKNSGIESVVYQVKLYGENNFLIAERFGEVPILPSMVIPIIETNIKTGNSNVVRSVFQFVEEEIWVKMDNPTDEIIVANETLTNTDTTPTVRANVKNTSIKNKSQIIFITTIFDTSGNAFASSRTFIESLGPNAERQIVFTWPEPFVLPVARVDIVPLMAP